MKLSTKGRYGLRAIIDLARYSEKEAVSIRVSPPARRSPSGYLEQLVAPSEEGGAGQKRAGSRRRIRAGQAGGRDLCGRRAPGSGRKPGTGKMSGIFMRRKYGCQGRTA